MQVKSSELGIEPQELDTDTSFDQFFCYTMMDMDCETESRILPQKLSYMVHLTHSIFLWGLEDFYHPYRLIFTWMSTGLDTLCALVNGCSLCLLVLY